MNKGIKTPVVNNLQNNPTINGLAPVKDVHNPTNNWITEKVK